MVGFSLDKEDVIVLMFRIYSGLQLANALGSVIFNDGWIFSQVLSACGSGMFHERRAKLQACSLGAGHRVSAVHRGP